MASEIDSIRALASESSETVVLTREFYECVVHDPRRRSGDFQPVLSHPPADLVKAVAAFEESPVSEPPEENDAEDRR